MLDFVLNMPLRDLCVYAAIVCIVLAAACAMGAYVLMGRGTDDTI